MKYVFFKAFSLLLWISVLRLVYHKKERKFESKSFTHLSEVKKVSLIKKNSRKILFHIYLLLKEKIDFFNTKIHNGTYTHV